MIVLDVVIGAVEASSVYSRIESLVTETVTDPRRSAVSTRVAGSRMAILCSACASWIAAVPLPIARPDEPPQSTDIG